MGAYPMGSWTATKREEGFRGHCAYLMTGKVPGCGGGYARNLRW